MQIRRLHRCSSEYFPTFASITVGVLLVCVFLGGTPCRAAGWEDPRFAHLTTDQGLSHNRILAILQDRQGFMWFATRDGLDRYDGNTFVVFKHNPDDPASLSSNFILDLLEDDQGCLWIATYNGGVNKFDPATQRFTRYRHDPQNPNSLSSDMVKHIARDHRGHLWFGTVDGGLNQFDPATATFTRYRVDRDGEYVGMVNAIIEDGRGDIWFAGDNGLFHLNLQTGQITRAAAIPNPMGATHLCQDQAGNLWLLVYCPVAGLAKYDRQAERFTTYPFAAGTVSLDVCNLLDDGRNGFWVASSEGLHHFDRQTERFTQRFQHDDTNPDSLNDNRIVSLYRDRAGLLWVGTQDRGINLLNFQPEQFGCYRHDRANPNSLSPGKVLAIHQDPDGIVWVGLRPRALDRLDRKTGQITHYVPGSDENSLGQGDEVNCLCRDAQGYLWVGGLGSGLDRFDEHSGRFKHYRSHTNDPNSLISDFVLTIHEDRGGRLWVGQYGGLSRFDRATEQFVNCRPEASDPASKRNDVATIYQDRSGVLWLGTSGGMLSRFDDQTGAFVNCQPDARAPRQLNGGAIHAIHEDQAGALWLAAEDGLYRYDRKKQTFTRYTENQGLPSSAMAGILEDDSGRLWVSTQNGLSRFDPRTETFKNYDASDGLQGNGFSQGCCERSPQGEMLFGGGAGFNAFFPENIRNDPYAPPVVLTDFQLFNKPVAIGPESPLQKAINRSDQITLRYDQEVFRLKFAPLSFAQPRKNRCAYTLEGFDRDWRFTDAGDHSATYTRLAPGHYTFHVKASNPDGVWNEQGASLRITVLPPWWLTWWFRAVALAALLGLAFTAYRWRIRAIERRNLELEQQLLERRRVAEEIRKLNAGLEERVRQRTAQLEAVNRELEAFSYSVSHDLRSPLCRINGFSQIILENNAGRLDDASRENFRRILTACRQMGQLIDDLIKLSRLSCGDLRRQQVDLSALARSVADDLQKSQPGRRVEFAIEPGLTADADAGLIRVVLENLLGNAWKFTGQQGGAKIEFGRATGGEQSAFFARDNGVGFDMAYADKLFGAFQRLHDAADFPGTGIGLATVQRVIRRHGGRVWAQGAPGQGATFYFTLPERDDQIPG